MKQLFKEQLSWVAKGTSRTPLITQYCLPLEHSCCIPLDISYVFTNLTSTSKIVLPKSTVMELQASIGSSESTECRDEDFSFYQMGRKAISLQTSTYSIGNNTKAEDQYYQLHVPCLGLCVALVDISPICEISIQHRITLLYIFTIQDILHI